MSCDENRRGITATKVWNFRTAPWFWCRDAGYLWWCHSVFCHGDEEDSRIWLLEIGKRRKPEIPVWEQGLMAGMRDGQRERWSDWEMARETWPEWVMARERDGQRGLAGMNDGLNKRWLEGIRVSENWLWYHEEFLNSFIDLFGTHHTHIYTNDWIRKYLSSLILS